MLNIAICDDDKLFLERLSDLITNEAKQKQYSIKIYKTDNSIEFAKQIEKNRYDVIILDIEMPELNGFDIADSYKGKSKIVFVTNHQELVFDSFKYHPYNFIRKDRIEDITEALSELMRIDCRKMLSITETVKKTYILLEDIVYINTNKNYVYINCENEIYKFRITIKDILNKLDNRFVQINSGEIVNTAYIKRISGRELTVSGSDGNEKSFVIAQSKYQKVVDAFLQGDEQ
jgi:DNA-binding LytR/AlgR family response regulator